MLRHEILYAVLFCFSVFAPIVLDLLAIATSQKRVYFYFFYVLCSHMMSIF